MNNNKNTSVALANTLLNAHKPINWALVEVGEKLWDQWRHEHFPGITLMTPRTSTLEEMARCSSKRFNALAIAEVKANRLLTKNGK